MSSRRCLLRAGSGGGDVVDPCAPIVTEFTPGYFYATSQSEWSPLSADLTGGVTLYYELPETGPFDFISFDYPSVVISAGYTEAQKQGSGAHRLIRGLVNDSPGAHATRFEVFAHAVNGSMATGWYFDDQGAEDADTLPLLLTELTTLSVDMESIRAFSRIALILGNLDDIEMQLITGTRDLSNYSLLFDANGRVDGDGGDDISGVPGAGIQVGASELVVATSPCDGYLAFDEAGLAHSFSSPVAVDGGVSVLLDCTVGRNAGAGDPLIVLYEGTPGSSTRSVQAYATSSGALVISAFDGSNNRDVSVVVSSPDQLVKIGFSINASSGEVRISLGGEVVIVSTSVPISRTSFDNMWLNNSPGWRTGSESIRRVAVFPSVITDEVLNAFTNVQVFGSLGDGYVFGLDVSTATSASDPVTELVSGDTITLPAGVTLVPRST